MIDDITSEGTRTTVKDWRKILNKYHTGSIEIHEKTVWLPHHELEFFIDRGLARVDEVCDYEEMAQCCGGGSSWGCWAEIVFTPEGRKILENIY